MKKKYLDIYQKLFKSLEEESEKILKWWAENVEEVERPYLCTFDKIDEGKIILSGPDENWIWRTVEIPAELLYNKEAKKKYLKD